MERRRPPETDEGWYVLHDCRTIDWDAWRDAPARERERALSEGVEFFQSALDVRDADEGDSALYAIIGHKADLMVVHLRPTMADLETLERRFEQTTLAQYTEQVYSYLSVTEMSGYTERGEEYFEGDLDEDDSLYRYIQARLHPEIPEMEHVSFYPMSKRRQPEQNWYDLPFDERAEHMESHGDIGRNYAGNVSQMICGSVGFDDYEWGITLWAEDPIAVKDLLYEMRFDQSSSLFGEFGPFYFGRRLPPSDFDEYMAGERVAEPAPGADAGTEASVRGELEGIGVDVSDAPEDAYGLVLYSDADQETVEEEVEGLRGNFEHYDSHVLTEVVDADGRTAIASVWATERAADTAQGFLEDLSGVSETVRGPLGGAGERDESADADAEAESIRETLAEEGVYAGKPHGEDVYALVVYSEADADELQAATEDLRDGFDRYDTHVTTAVYEASGDGDGDLAVVSLWETESAAETASGFLTDLPDVVREAGEGDGWGTMGMFYTVKPAHREDFVEKFDVVGGLLEDMDGHHRTDLMVNREDENDMFIASRWASKEDAMAFFRSDEFGDTVEWGRDVLAARPRHVFLA